MKKRFITAMILITTASGCSSMRSFFALNDKPEAPSPIANPFGYVDDNEKTPNVVLRSRRGDRTMELELPGGDKNLSDLSFPISPSFRGANAPSRGVASVPAYTPASPFYPNSLSNDGSAGASGGDDTPEIDYRARKPSVADREILQTMPQGSFSDRQTQAQIENNLGLAPGDDSVPERDQSYLASLDHVKTLYRAGRYEVALLEVEELLKSYQTDPKLYEMRGTLLDRVGQPRLAIRSWDQALHLDPANAPLRRFIERKRQIAGAAGGAR